MKKFLYQRSCLPSLAHELQETLKQKKLVRETHKFPEPLNSVLAVVSHVLFEQWELKIFGPLLVRFITFEGLIRWLNLSFKGGWWIHS